MKFTGLAIFFFSINVFSSAFLHGSWSGNGKITTKTPYGEILKDCPSVVLNIAQKINEIDIIKGQFDCEGSVSKSFNPVILDVNEEADVFYQLTKVGHLSESELQISFSTPSSGGTVSLTALLNDQNQLEIKQVEKTLFGLELITEALLELDSTP